MKRDIDLVRLLLLRSEGDEDAKRKVEEYADDVRAYHVTIMLDAGLFIGESDKLADGSYATSVTRLTWNGHDFLDAARNETVWRKARETILRTVGSVTFDLLLEWLKSEGRKQIGLPPI